MGFGFWGLGLGVSILGFEGNVVLFAADPYKTSTSSEPKTRFQISEQRAFEG